MTIKLTMQPDEHIRLDADTVETGGTVTLTDDIETALAAL